MAEEKTEGIPAPRDPCVAFQSRKLLALILGPLSGSGPGHAKAQVA